MYLFIQLQNNSGTSDNFTSEVPDQFLLDNNRTMQSVGWNPQSLIENRCVTAGLPSSPLRTSFNPAGGIFNFALPTPVDHTSYESQLMQRLQALSGYTSPTLYPYPLQQTMSFLPPSLYGPSFLNNNYPLQLPPQKNVNSVQGTSFRNSYAGSTVTDPAIPANRNSEPRQLPSTPQYQASPVFQFSIPTQQENSNLNNDINLSGQYHPTLHNPASHQNVPSASQNLPFVNLQYQKSQPSTNPSHSQTPLKKNSNSNQNQSVSNLKILQRDQREKSPNVRSSKEKEVTHFIKPLPQMGTLTTTDSDGRLRVIVPVPSDGVEASEDLLANLKLGNTLRPSNGPAITRSTSERVPNRSELMSQVQRTVWARHTTK